MRSPSSPAPDLYPGCNVQAARAVGLSVAEPLKSRSPPAFKEDLVRQLVTRRQELGITQDDVNYRLGVADRLVAKWECGDRTPSGFLLWCWARTLGCKLTLEEG